MVEEGSDRPLAVSTGRTVVSTGCWPQVVAAPTGSGKSSVIDVHVYAMAATADSAVRPPRRMAVVVNRRALVDSHLQRAERLSALLDTASEGVLAEVAERLRSRSGTEQALLVASIRGGVHHPGRRCRIADKTPTGSASRPGHRSRSVAAVTAAAGDGCVPPQSARRWPRPEPSQQACWRSRCTAARPLFEPARVWSSQDTRLAAGR